MRSPTNLKRFLIAALVLGIVFRFVNLNHKVYWHDEVYTSLRAAGYTRQEIDQRLFQNQVLPVVELQQFQQIKPGSTPADTVRSLAVEDPQHPPLYFLLTRFWMQQLGHPLSTLFHSSLTTFRSLPALLSLLSLPLMYALAYRLFSSPLAALLATTFLALSPFDILFAQTARQYSLLTAIVIASQWWLIRAMQIGERPKEETGETLNGARWRHWLLYAASVAVGLYTHPFFGLTAIAQGAYVGLEAFKQRHRRAIVLSWLAGFGLALVVAIALYTPWILVLLENSQRAMATTDWTRIFPGLDYLTKLWILSFTALFLDLDFGFNNPITFWLRVPIGLLIVGAIYTLCRQCKHSVWLCILTSILVPFLLLAIPDLLIGGKRSTVSRYLISCYPGVQLAVAYLFSTKLAVPTVSASNRRLWRTLLALLLTASVVSCTTSALAFTWWNKDLSYFNAETAHRVNAVPSAIVISDLGDDFTNTGDLISLSYLLHPTVPLLLLRDSEWAKADQFRAQIQALSPIVFRPSQKLRHILEQQGTLEPMFPEAQLWRYQQRR